LEATPKRTTTTPEERVSELGFVMNNQAAEKRARKWNKIKIAWKDKLDEELQAWEREQQQRSQSPATELRFNGKKLDENEKEKEKDDPDELAKGKGEKKKLMSIKAEIRKDQELLEQDRFRLQQEVLAMEESKRKLMEAINKYKRKKAAFKTKCAELETETEKVQMLEKREKEIADKERAVELEKEEWEAQKKAMAQYHLPGTKRIKLNVGGQVFTTTLDTLRSAPQSMLSSMFSGRFELDVDEDGCVFIDRDPTHFRLILNFLRVGATALPENNVQLEELLQEAHFYQLTGLVTRVQDKLQPYQIEWRIPYHRLKEVKQKGLWYGDKWTLHNIDWHVAIETPVPTDRRHICVWVGTKGHEYPVEYQKDTALRFTSSCRILDQTGEDHVVSLKQDITLLSPSRWKGHDFDFQPIHLDPHQYLTIQVRIDSFAWQKKLG
jgi:hypothetical protein